MAHLHPHLYLLYPDSTSTRNGLALMSVIDWICILLSFLQVQPVMCRPVSFFLVLLLLVSVHLSWQTLLVLPEHLILPGVLVPASLSWTLMVAGSSFHTSLRLPGTLDPSREQLLDTCLQPNPKVFEHSPFASALI